MHFHIKEKPKCCSYQGTVTMLSFPSIVLLYSSCDAWIIV